MRNKSSYSEAGKLGNVASSQTRAEQKRRRVTDWYTNPKLCKFCSTPISYEKRLNDFCNQSCGAKYHNTSRGFELSNGKTFTCLFCLEPFEANGMGEHKYCSRECMMEFWWEDSKVELLKGGIDFSAGNRLGKRYLIELHQGKCQICSEGSWQGQPMPLVLDHINGNPYDNSLINLRVICHNCNAQTPTFAGRNKGNGRVERARRYQVEKEVFQKLKADVVQK